MYLESVRASKFTIFAIQLLTKIKTVANPLCIFFWRRGQIIACYNNRSIIRALTLCPVRKSADGGPVEPNQAMRVSGLGPLCIIE